MSSTIAAIKRGQVTRQAVARLREIVRDGLLPRWTEVDLQNGEMQNPDARALFASLPAISPATDPNELVENGLISKVPAGLADALDEPKYRPGREVFVQAPSAIRATSSRRPMGDYWANGELRFTHRGILRGIDGDDFMIELTGAPALLRYERSQLLSWNEPCGVPAAGGSISGVQVDYNDPLLKAHICAGYLEIDEALGALDFGDEDAAGRQIRLIHQVASLPRMTYSGRGSGYAGARLGALIHGGQGGCFTQRAVVGAFLQAFCSVLAFELQFAVGRTVRTGAPHGFLVVLIRPSLRRFVCDPAWSEPLTDLRVAFFGPGWGHDRMLLGFEGKQDLRVPPEALDLPIVESAS